MIEINDCIMYPEHFPDGTFMEFNFNVESSYKYNIMWKYGDEGELLLLYYYVNHIREIYGKYASIDLYVPYLPQARMDRTYNNKQVFTLKHIAKFINDLNFDNVYVLDPHSNVSVGLIERCRVMDVEPYIQKAIDKCKNDEKDFMIFFPDDGALKRYGKLKCFDGYAKIYGKKERDFSTGEITGLKIFSDTDEDVTILNGKTVLMVDDIISYGGTFAHSAHKLYDLGCDDIYAYASHVENSYFDEFKGTLYNKYKEGIVKEVFTTDSISRFCMNALTVVDNIKANKIVKNKDNNDNFTEFINKLKNIL